MGIGLLTFYVAAARPELVNLSSDRVPIARILWLALPEDLFETQRIRTGCAFLREVLGNHTHSFRR